MFNICAELRCPFNDKVSGCRRFATPYLCPVGVGEDISPNKHWLHAKDDASIDINYLENKLRYQVIEKELGQRQLKTELRIYGEGFHEFLASGGSLQGWEEQQEKACDAV